MRNGRYSRTPLRWLAISMRRNGTVFVGEFGQEYPNLVDQPRNLLRADRSAETGLSSPIETAADRLLAASIRAGRAARSGRGRSSTASPTGHGRGVRGAGLRRRIQEDRSHQSCKGHRGMEHSLLALPSLELRKGDLGQACRHLSEAKEMYRATVGCCEMRLAPA